MNNTLELINKEELQIVYELLGRLAQNSKAQRAEIEKLQAEKASYLLVIEKWEAATLSSLEAADYLDPELAVDMKVTYKEGKVNRVEYVGWPECWKTQEGEMQQLSKGESDNE